MSGKTWKLAVSVMLCWSLVGVMAQSPDQRSIVAALIAKSDSLFPVDEMAALRCLREADSISSAIHFESGIFRSNLIMASVRKYNPVDSRRYLNKITHLLPVVNDTLKTEYHLYYGYALSGMGEKSEAIAHYIQADSFARNTNFLPYLARVNDYFASLYYTDKEYTKAIGHIRQSSEVYRELGIRHSYLNSLLNMGVIYEKLDVLDSALFYLEQSLRLSEEEYGVRGSFSVYILYEMAKTYYKKNDVASCQHYLNKAENLLDSSTAGGSDGILIAELNGDLLVSKGKTDLAVIKYKEAYRIAGNSQSYSDLVRLAKKLADVMLDQPGNQEGVGYLRHYLQLKDSLDLVEGEKRKEQLKVKYEVDKKESENLLLRQKMVLEEEKLTRSRLVTYGILLLALILSGVVYLLYAQKKRNETLRYLQLEQKLLRTQMNPHFVFNALNTIQNFLLNNETKTSVKYLSRFAKLMRGILESSRKELIDLDQEIELMTYYLDYQKLQFPTLFEVNIVVDERLDLEDTMIPPLLTQPFIENAVKHAFKENSQQQNLISLTYAASSRDDGGIRITIEDNGAGMEANPKNPKNPENPESDTRTAHRSYALQITRERIANLKKMLRQEIGFKTFSNPGTKVIFEIPRLTGSHDKSIYSR